LRWEPCRPLRRGVINFHGARRGGRGIPCIPLHVHVYWFRVGFHRCHQGVPRGETLRGRSHLRWGVRPCLRRLPRVEERPAGPSRGGGHRGGAGLGCGPGGGGAHRPGWMEVLHVPPALRLLGHAPQGQAIRMAVGRHELRAWDPALGCLLRVGLPHGRWRGQGLLGLRPRARVQQKRPGPPLGGWHEV